MRRKRQKICEVLVSTVIISVATVTLFWSFALIQNWQNQAGIRTFLLGFLAGIFFGLLTMGIYIIPSAFLVSILLASLRRWSLTGVAGLLLVVVICTSVTSYLIDPTTSRPLDGSAGYFTRLEWFASQFTLIGVITGFAGSLIAFWQCCDAGGVLRFRIE
jgi:hypothetical protein